MVAAMGARKPRNMWPIRGKLLSRLIGASRPQDQLQVPGKPHAHCGIDFEVTDPSVVAGATLVNQSKINKPLQTAVDGCRRTKFQQQQPLDRQRASLLLLIAEFDNKCTINLGLKAGEIVLRECLKPSKLLKHTFMLDTQFSDNKNKPQIITIYVINKTQLQK